VSRAWFFRPRLDFRVEIAAASGLQSLTEQNSNSRRGEWSESTLIAELPCLTLREMLLVQVAA
jgi:hypothetical protein